MNSFDGKLGVHRKLLPIPPSLGTTFWPHFDIENVRKLDAVLTEYFPLAFKFAQIMLMRLTSVFYAINKADGLNNMRRGVVISQ